MYFLFMFIFYLLLLLAVGLLTITERFFLSLSQIRLGPQKVSFLALFQMVLDGIKLYFSELIFIKKSDFFFYFFFPLLSFFLMMMFYLFLSYNFVFLSWVMLMIFMIFFIGFLVFFMLLNSFFSKSKYSYLGLVRIIMGSLGFDIIFFLFLFVFMFFFLEMMVNKMYNYFMIISIMLFVVLMIEVNRAPFDFSEGESELVSGFNTELSSLLFVLVFLSEYGFLIFYILLMNSLVMNGNIYLSFWVFFCYIEIRAVFPRFRYDYMVSLCWLILLPMMMFFFFLVFCNFP